MSIDKVTIIDLRGAKCDGRCMLCKTYPCVKPEGAGECYINEPPE